MDVTVEPVTPERWDHVVAVFGEHGDPSRCWCSYLLRESYDMTQRAANRSALRTAIDGGRDVGLLAYADGGPVGWAAVGPRREFAGRLERSPILRPVPFDGGEVWSVLCFVVPKAHRGQGVSAALLAGAVEHARSRGAAAIEGAPRDNTGGQRWSAGMAYTGMASTFAAAGFTEIDRRRDRPTYRLVLRSGSGHKGR